MKFRPLGYPEELQCKLKLLYAAMPIVLTQICHWSLEVVATVVSNNTRLAIALASSYLSTCTELVTGYSLRPPRLNDLIFLDLLK